MRVLDIDFNIWKKSHETIHLEIRSWWLQGIIDRHCQEISSENFEESAVKAKISRCGKQAEVRIQRDILGRLVSLSSQHEAPLDIEAAMTYPLAPISLTLCNSDGSIRKANKSSLYQAAMTELSILSPEDLPPKEDLSTYFLDLAATIRTQLKECETIKQLAWRIVSSVPQQFQTIFIVCDTYLSNSIKGGERRLRGEGKRYVLKSTSMKLPSDMANFLRNGQNKEMMFNLLEEAITEEKTKLKNRTVYYSNKSWCTKITSTNVSRINAFLSDHEEADTKLVALVNSFNITGNTVLIRSPSGDIDILVLFLLHQFKNKRVLIDNDTGKSRKIIDMSSTTLTQLKRQALAGIHAFSGNDYISAFFRKGKRKFWKLLMENEEFIQTFTNLGLFGHVMEETRDELEKFVCLVYGNGKCTSVDQLRAKIFQQKFKYKKAVDLFLIPPCSRNLTLHIRRSNYVANMYSEANRLMMLLESPSLHGWNANGEPEWTEQCFPDDLHDLLLQEHVDEEQNSDKDEEEESSDDDYSDDNDYSDDDDFDTV